MKCHRIGRIVMLVVSSFSIVCRESDYSTPRHEIRPGAAKARKNLSQVLYALREYRQRYGKFPSHPVNQWQALYELRAHVSDEYFNNPLFGDMKAFWDDGKRIIAFSDWQYFNQSDAQEPCQVVLASRPKMGSGLVYLGLARGDIIAHSVPKHGDQSFIGNFVSRDEFVFTDHDVYQEWIELLRSIPAWSLEVNGVRNSMSCDQFDIRWRYLYVDRTLGQRITEFGSHHVVDKVLTDEVGRISSLKRSPPNWRELWESHLKRYTIPDDARGRTQTEGSTGI